MFDRLHLKKKGFSLIEMVAVLAVIGVLLSLLLPAVQSAREAARRTQCSNHLRQIGIAFHQYHDSNKTFPGYQGIQYSFHVQILPYIEQSPLFEKFQSNFSDSAAIERLSQNRIRLYHCPSDPHSVPTTTNYAGNCGVFVLDSQDLNGPLNHEMSEITDGLSNTALVSEILVGVGEPNLKRTLWRTPRQLVGLELADQFAHFCRETAFQGQNAGDHFRGSHWPFAEQSAGYYNHIMLPDDVSCINKTNVTFGALTAGSQHPQGVYACCTDGHVKFISSQIGFEVWRGFGSRSGNEVVQF